MIVLPPQRPPACRGSSTDKPKGDWTSSSNLAATLRAQDLAASGTGYEAQNAANRKQAWWAARAAENFAPYILMIKDVGLEKVHG